MSSSFFESILSGELDKEGRETGLERKQTSSASYSVSVQDQRGSNPISVSFNFKKAPINEIQADGVLSVISENLDTVGIDLAETILRRFARVGKDSPTRKTGSVKLSYYESEDRPGAAARESKNQYGIQTTSGKFVSQVNLRSMLQVAMWKYIIEDMKQPDAPLKFRTGRFASSAKLSTVRLSEKATQVSLYFTYMMRPYAVFDPRYGNKLASSGRNPQRIIGEALEKAAKDIIHARYRVRITQGAK